MGVVFVNLKVEYDLVHNGVKFSNGDILEGDFFENKQKNRLLRLGAVSECRESVNVEIHEDESEIKDSPEIALDIPKIDDEFEEVDLTDEDVKKEIDAGFTHTELVQEMEAVNMKFKKSDSKVKLIDLIIEKEMDEHFLDLLEGR